MCHAMLEKTSYSFIRKTKYVHTSFHIYKKSQINLNSTDQWIRSLSLYLHLIFNLFLKTEIIESKKNNGWNWMLYINKNWILYINNELMHTA